VVAYAQTCPSKETYIRIVSMEDEKITGLFVLKIEPNVLPGTEDSCPAFDLVTNMIEYNKKTGKYSQVPVFLERNSLNDPLNVLTHEEVKEYLEKGIVRPPQKTPEIQKEEFKTKPGERLVIDEHKETLYSSVN